MAPLTRHRRGAPHSHALGDLIEDSDAAAHIAQPGERFTQRYSARERRTVDRFNPLAYKGPGGSGGSGRSHDAARPHKRVRHAGYDDAGHDTDGSLSDEDLEEEEEALEDDGVPRKTYEFRDRSLVTIDRSAQQPQQAPRPAPHERFDRRRMRRGGRREGRRSRDYGPYDELPDLPVVHGAGYVGVTGQLPGGTEPWAAALGAAGLAPAGLGAASGAPHNSAAIAGGGGGGGSGGLGAASGAANLEITPVEVDPSVTFEQVGGVGALRARPQRNGVLAPRVP